MKFFYLFFILPILFISGCNIVSDNNSTLADFEYEIILSEVIITSYNGSEKDLVIPNTIEDLPVTKIGEGAFENNKILENLVVGEYVRVIETYAFQNCINLNKISLPAKAIILGSNILNGCNNLETIILSSELKCELSYLFGSEEDIPNTLTKIKYANGCSKIDKTLISSYQKNVITLEFSDDTTEIKDNEFKEFKKEINIIIPEGVSRIGKYAFAWSDIKSISIPSSVTIIGYSAFYGCDFLENVNIANGLKKIDSLAFDGCHKLDFIMIPDTVEDFGGYIFPAGSKIFILTSALKRPKAWFGYDFCGKPLILGVKSYGINDQFKYIVKVDDTVMITGLSSKIEESITIPEEIDGKRVTAIHEKAFYYKSFKTITLPNNLLSIADNAFFGCSDLETVIFKDNPQIKTIGEKAFYHCSNLTNFIIPNGVTSIGNEAFYYCKVPLIIPETVNYIGSEAIKNAYIKADIKPSGWEEDWNRGGLIIWGFQEIKENETFKYIVQTNSITILGLADSSTETNLVIPNTLEGKVVNKLANFAFQGEQQILSVIIPNTITEIPIFAFAFLPNLETLIFEENSILTIIDNQAFHDCSKLKKIILPSSLKSIGRNAFDLCNSLEQIIIPDGLEIIHEYAFTYCSNLKTITIPMSVSIIENGVFVGCDNLTINVRASSKPVGWSDTWNNVNQPVVWGYIN